MHFSQTRAPRATPELPAPARQASSRTVTATNDRPRTLPPIWRESGSATMTVRAALERPFCALAAMSGVRLAGH
jgi:hypothetical protein